MEIGPEPALDEQPGVLVGMGQFATGPAQENEFRRALRFNPFLLERERRVGLGGKNHKIPKADFPEPARLKKGAQTAATGIVQRGRRDNGDFGCHFEGYPPVAQILIHGLREVQRPKKVGKV
jgi:hypothetical protein